MFEAIVYLLIGKNEKLNNPSEDNTYSQDLVIRYE